MRAHRLFLPFAAFLAVLPLLLHGPSCGHDFDFHLLNWVEAAHQIAQGHYPHWAYLPAYHAGEPRFIFYPPLSWLFGAALTSLLPLRFTPVAYTFCCLLLSGLSFHRLARLWTSESAATLAAIFYLLNPYSLLTAYERTAYAELLAAAFIPLLFAAILRPRPTISGIALPVALLWLTNAPAAVMSTYALAVLALVRLLWPVRSTAIDNSQVITCYGHDAKSKELDEVGPLHPNRFHLALTTLAGTALGLALPAFYLIPAAYERRWVEINMAVLEGLRPSDNTLFHHTPDPAHDAVLHMASLIAVLLLSLTGAAFLGFYRQYRETRSLLPCLSILATLIGFLLTPWSLPFWNHLPELAFLQFPWRTLALLACCLALALALAVRTLTMRPAVLGFSSLILAAALIFHPYAHRDPDLSMFTPEFVQGCEPAESLMGREQLPPALANTAPTDEYTPIDIDNDELHPGDPAWWLLAPTASINTPAPTGMPEAGAPDHLTLTLPHPATLVLNRRNYPAWQITRNGQRIEPQSREDGLIALALPAGESTLVLTFLRTPDRLLGTIVSMLALGLLLLELIRKRAASARTAESQNGAHRLPGG